MKIPAGYHWCRKQQSAEVKWMRVLNISTEFIFYSKISHIWKYICQYMRWYCTLMFVWVTHWSHQCFFLGLVVCVFLISGWFDQVTFYLIPLYHSSYCSKDDTELCCSLSIISLCWSYILSCIFWNLPFLGFVCFFFHGLYGLSCFLEFAVEDWRVSVASNIMNFSYFKPLNTRSIFTNWPWKRKKRRRNWEAISNFLSTTS